MFLYNEIATTPITDYFLLKVFKKQLLHKLFSFQERLDWMILEVTSNLVFYNSIDEKQQYRERECNNEP